MAIYFEGTKKAYLAELKEHIYWNELTQKDLDFLTGLIQEKLDEPDDESNPECLSARIEVKQNRIYTTEQRRAEFAKKLGQATTFAKGVCEKIFDYIDDIGGDEQAEDPWMSEVGDFGIFGMYFQPFDSLHDLECLDYLGRISGMGCISIESFQDLDGKQRHKVEFDCGTAFALRFYTNEQGKPDVAGIINLV